MSADGGRSRAFGPVDGTLPAHPAFDPILARYARGEVSAYDAACEIQDLGLPGYHDPSASEVVLWAKQTGHGIPSPSEAEARAEADRILERGGETE
jgi:hypothetical protein